MTDTHLSDVRFADLNLHPLLQEGLDEIGFDFCTPIQAAALPMALEGVDVAGQAQTGTGKTAAFLLATMDILLKNEVTEQRKANQPRAIVIAPTRELAIQIHKDALALSSHTDMKLALVYGGVDYEKQRKSLGDSIDILIGTPGRIIDYFKQRVFDLRAIQVAVLDEADRMFDLGFIKDIRFMFRRMPKPEERLSMMFSATLSFRVKELAYEHMNNPQSVVIETENVTADSVKQTLYHVQNEEKIPLLLGLLNGLDSPRAIIFVNTKRVGEKVTAWLSGNDFKAGLISGDVPQRKRQRLIDDVLKGEIRILVATDVAARGLHIPEVSHVINYDLPQSQEDYVHRIGRTARAGATGEAISMACEEYVFSLMEIEEYIGHKITVESITGDLLQTDLKPPIKIRKKSSHHKNQKRTNSNQRNRKRHQNNRHQDKPKPGVSSESKS